MAIVKLNTVQMVAKLKVIQAKHTDVLLYGIGL